MVYLSFFFHSVSCCCTLFFSQYLICAAIGKASRCHKARSCSSQPNRLARARHPAARRSRASGRLSQPGIRVVCTARHPARTQGIQPLVAAVHQAVRHSPASRAHARHPAARRSRASGRLSQPGVPLMRGIQPLVAAVHPAVRHGQASRVCEASSRLSQLCIRPFVTARSPATTM